MMVFGIVFAAQLGMSLIPFKQAALTVFSAYETMPGVGIDYAKYMLIAACSCVGGILLFVGLGKYVFRPDMSKLKNLDVKELDTANTLSLNRAEKLILCFLFALVALRLMPNFLPSDLFATRFLKAIGNTGICIFLMMAMCFLKVDGVPLLKLKTMIDSGVAWGSHGCQGKRHYKLPHDACLRTVYRLHCHGTYPGHEEWCCRRSPHAGHFQLYCRLVEHTVLTPCSKLEEHERHPYIRYLSCSLKRTWKLFKAKTVDKVLDR